MASTGLPPLQPARELCGTSREVSGRVSSHEAGVAAAAVRKATVSPGGSHRREAAPSLAGTIARSRHGRGVSQMPVLASGRSASHDMTSGPLQTSAGVPSNEARGEQTKVGAAVGFFADALLALVFRILLLAGTSYPAAPRQSIADAIDSKRIRLVRQLIVNDAR